MRFINKCIFKVRFNKRVFARVVLTLILVVTILTILDLFIRIFIRREKDVKIVRANHLLQYELTPNNQFVLLNPKNTPITYTIDNFGFRQNELLFENNKADVVILGDSVAFGYYSNNNQTISALLQNRLNDYRVINAGVPGYTSTQALLALETRLLSMYPKVIIVMIGWNDLVFSTLPNWQPYYTSHMFTSNESLIQPQMDRLKKVFIENNVFLKTLNRFFSDKEVMDDAQLMKSRETSNNIYHTKALEIYVNNLKSIIGISQAHNITPIIVTLPSILSNNLSETDKKLMLTYLRNVPNLNYLGWIELSRNYNNAIREVARQGNAQLVDLDEFFQSLPDNTKIESFFDILHPTASGNELISDLLYKELQRSNLF